MEGERGKYGLGVKPELDIEKAEELCGLEEGTYLSYPVIILPYLKLWLTQRPIIHLTPGDITEDPR